MEADNFESFEMDVAPQQPRSYLHFLIVSLGLRYTIGLPLVALLSFIAIVLLLLFGKNRYVGAAILTILPMEPLMGMYAFVDGLIASFQVISMAGVAPKPADMAEGFAMSLVATLVSLALSCPIFLTAAVGLSIRAILPDTQPVVSAPSKTTP